MKSIISFLLIIIFSLNIHSAIDANKIVIKADNFRGYTKWFSSISKITYYKHDKIKSTQHLKVHVKDSDNSLVKFIKPVSMKGRVLLMTGNNVWIHIPKTKNPIRLTPQQRLLGQVSNGDIARMNYQQDYDATLLGYKVVQKRQCYHLLLKAKRKNTTYQKIEYFVEKSTNKPVKAIFFAKSGKILKEGYFKKPKIFNGRTFISQLEIKDYLKPYERTTIESMSIKRERIPSQYFNKNFLKRIR